MKKTLVALSVAAFAASASAVTVYENEGSKFEVGGRVHVAAAKQTTKVEKNPSTGHSKLFNQGSRFNFTATHNVNDDLTAFGHAELRFDGKDSHTIKATDSKNQTYVVTTTTTTTTGNTITTTTTPKDTPVQSYTIASSQAGGSSSWGSAYIKRAYVGLSSKSAGSTVTFGNQVLIGDSIDRVGVDNLFGVGSALKAIGGEDILVSDAPAAVEYKFTGVKGLTVAANYVFAHSHDTVGSVKAGYNAGVVYGFDIAEGQKLTASIGYSHTDFQNVGDEDNRDKNGIYGNVDFATDMFKVGIAGGRAVTKDKDGYKTNVTSFIRTGAKVKVADKVSVYGNYGYVVVGDEDKDKAHRFMLGTEYQLHKNVKTYVEAKLDRIRFANHTKQTDKGIGAGLNVMF